MKARDIKAIYEAILPTLPGFEAKGPLLFVSPIDHILKAFCIEGSDFDSFSFYIWVFVLPLYVPTKYLYFSFGNRLTDQQSDRWSFTEENKEELVGDLLKAMRQQGLSFLFKIDTPLDLASKASLFSVAPNDPYLGEAVAYSLVLADKTSEAMEALKFLNALLAGIDQQKTWIEDIRRRALSVRKHLSESPAEAKKLLMKWEQQTLLNLKLESFAR